ncbi:MAG: hypothetical protein LW823_02425 [Rickettsiales bacterium]|jgi:hypothetical protein|nr:hypothetical protein [Rickettsiales bacterium]
MFARKQDELVFLSKGTHEGRHTWHYLLVKKMKLPQLMEAVKQGQVDLAQYGRILFSGFGANPPADVTLLVRQKFG